MPAGKQAGLCRRQACRPVSAHASFYGGALAPWTRPVCVAPLKAAPSGPRRARRRPSEFRAAGGRRSDERPAPRAYLSSRALSCQDCVSQACAARGGSRDVSESESESRRPARVVTATPARKTAGAQGLCRPGSRVAHYCRGVGITAWSARFLPELASGMARLGAMNDMSAAAADRGPDPARARQGRSGRSGPRTAPSAYMHMSMCTYACSERILRTGRARASAGDRAGHGPRRGTWRPAGDRAGVERAWAGTATAAVADRASADSGLRNLLARSRRRIWSLRQGTWRLSIGHAFPCLEASAHLQVSTSAGVSLRPRASGFVPGERECCDAARVSAANSAPGPHP